jgi:hypothetical protein
LTNSNCWSEIPFSVWSNADHVTTITPTQNLNQRKNSLEHSRLFFKNAFFKIIFETFCQRVSLIFFFETCSETVKTIWNILPPGSFKLLCATIFKFVIINIVGAELASIVIGESVAGVSGIFSDLKGKGFLENNKSVVWILFLKTMNC